MKKIRIGTRKSPLAVWQAEFIGRRLEEQGLAYELIKIETKGDKILDQSLSKIGSKGVFTEELEIMLEQGDIDLAQHSAKDLTSDLPANLPIIAFTKRELANDVLVSFNPELRLNTDSNLIIGTSSTRRQAILNYHFPQHRQVEMRGNLQTRIEKLKNGAADAILLAYAGVHRMGLEHLIAEKLPLDVFTPAVGQGSVAIQASDKLDPSLKNKIRQILNDQETETCITAERSILQKINGGCSIPFFGYCEFLQDHYSIRAGIYDKENGKTLIVNKQGKNAHDLAEEIAEELLEKNILSIIHRLKLNQP